VASIQTGSATSIFKIQKFRGLNENPDGDTKLQPGELAVMRNFCVTRDGHLQLRPGTKTVLALREAWEAWAQGREAVEEEPRFCGAWQGRSGDRELLLAAFGGAIFELSLTDGTAKSVGSCTQDAAHFFGFAGNVYLLNGHEYLCWDGGEATEFAPVEPYIPLVLTAADPAGNGTALENVNRLTGKRRARYSPDGSAKEFYLPEQDVSAIVAVEGFTGTYTLDASMGKVTFASAPAKGVNTLTITWDKGVDAAEEVAAMRFSELYNGLSDTRVFLYGDGSNRTIYSGVEFQSGRPTAAYFPDLFEASIGEANTPITALVRHYSRLLVFKTDSAWSIQSDTMTTAAGNTVPAFYVMPVNRQVGNAAPGQARLLENSPLTLFEKHIYQWSAAASGGNITADMRNAKRISDRVTATLGGFDLSAVRTFNRAGESEFWFLSGTQALILNYANDSWYRYEGLPFAQLLELEGELYGFTPEGALRHVSRRWRNDDGQEIDARAETGSMAFDRAWLLKYSPLLFVAIKPESGARLTVTVETNRRGDYPEKLISSGLATFSSVSFAHFSFGTNRKPRVERVKMKVKKATFYKIIYKSLSASAAATVLETDIQLRYAGNVK